MEHVIRLELNNKLDGLITITNAVEDYWYKNSLNQKLLFNISLAVDEIFSNIVRHAFNESEEHKIYFNAYKDGYKFITEFIDDGHAFNPLERAEPDLNIDIDEREPGGLGIFLVKNFSEKMEYARESNKNKLIVTFNLNVGE